MSEIAFTLANMGIFCGYLFIAFVVVPAFDVTRWFTKVGGFFFFVTCGFTHLELASHLWLTDGLPRSEMTSWHMTAIHTVQVVAVWLFVIGLYVEFVHPSFTPKSPDKRIREG